MGARWHKWVQLGGQPPFSPLSIPDLILWLRSDQALNGLGVQASNGEGIATWPDLSGNGNDCVQAVAASQPVYTTGVYNGEAALRCNGAVNSRHLQGTVSLNNSNWTLMVVSKQNIAAASQGFFDASANLLTNNGFAHIQEGGVRKTRCSGANDVGYFFGGTGIMVHFSRAVQPVVPTGNNTRKIYEKDVEKATADLIMLEQAMVNYRVGILFQGVFPVDGDIVEYALYNRALDPVTEITPLSNYAIARYAIP